MAFKQTPTSKRASAFRGRRTRPPLHILEKLLLSIVIIHLCLMPWALGTMWWQCQAVSALLSAIGFLIALLPRTYHGRLPTGSFRLIPTPKLLRFVPFWCGLLLVTCICVQGFNPSWQYVTTTKAWWLTKLHYIPWLPSGVLSPFFKFNSWRSLIILGDAWLLLCSIWIGFTERRSVRILLGCVASNGVLLGLYLAGQHITGNFGVAWAPAGWNHALFTSTFVYKNHAGAYFALCASCAAALTVWATEYGIITMKRSTPASLWGAVAVGLVFVVGFTLSRGASLILVATSIPFGLWLLFWRRRLPQVATTGFKVRTLMFATAGVGFLAMIKYLDFSVVYGHLQQLTKQEGYELSVGSRILVRTAALEMLAKSWVRGVGAGGFRYLFPEFIKNYPQIYDHGKLYWEHAHCDWLEFPIELGILGDLVIVSSLSWWIMHFVRSKISWNTLAVPLLLGCLQTVAHAGFEFPFQCPAVLALWCALLAAAGKYAELSRSDTIATPI